jgi:biotin carboxylase
MNKRILVVGAGTYQLPIIKDAKTMGCEVIAVDGDPQAPGLVLADIAKAVDLRDADGCLQVAKEYSIDGVVSIATEVAIESVAYVAEVLGLPGIYTKVAAAVTDKVLMRQCLVNAGIPCPRFTAAIDLEQARAAACDIGYPLVIKPVDNAGSRGVSKVDAPEQLDAAFVSALDFSRKKVVIVEEFMEGIEATVEALSYAGETEVLAISDKYHVPFPHCVAVSLNYPPYFSEDIQREIRDVVVKSINALGVDCGPTHTEVMVTRTGVKMVEVAARGGGFKVFSDVISLASGVDAVRATLMMALGQRPDFKPRFQRGVVLRFFNPQREGNLRQIIGVEEARKMPGVFDLVIEKSPGDAIRTITADGERPGYFIASADDRQAVMKLADDVENRVEFLVD